MHQATYAYQTFHHLSQEEEEDTLNSEMIFHQHNAQIQPIYQLASSEAHSKCSNHDSIHGTVNRMQRSSQQRVSFALDTENTFAADEAPVKAFAPRNLEPAV